METQHQFSLSADSDGTTAERSGRDPQLFLPMSSKCWMGLDKIVRRCRLLKCSSSAWLARDTGRRHAWDNNWETGRLIFLFTGQPVIRIWSYFQRLPVDRKSLIAIRVYSSRRNQEGAVNCMVCILVTSLSILLSVQMMRQRKEE